VLLSLSSHTVFDLLIDIQVATQESIFGFGFITRLESTITGFKFHKLKTRNLVFQHLHFRMLRDLPVLDGNTSY
jgi:hypothetical protein